MGSSSSKPAEGQSAHVWKAQGPVGVSHDVVQSLQGSTETDVSRAQTLELAVQARVAEELKKLQQKESASLKAAQQKVSEITEPEDAGKSCQVVSKEVEALRARLDKRKQLRELPDSVEKARSEVIQCLIGNDRRPLNCWKEVEVFKEEVRKLEKQWVEKVVR